MIEREIALEQPLVDRETQPRQLAEDEPEKQRPERPGQTKRR